MNLFLSNLPSLTENIHILALLSTESSKITAFVLPMLHHLSYDSMHSNTHTYKRTDEANTLFALGAITSKVLLSCHFSSILFNNPQTLYSKLIIGSLLRLHRYRRLQIVLLFVLLSQYHLERIESLPDRFSIKLFL